jgi:hypothetical protein
MKAKSIPSSIEHRIEQQEEKNNNKLIDSLR